VTVSLDPVNQLVVIPTYATTFATRLAIDFNLAASNVVDLSTSPATVTVRPFLTVATSPPDNKPIRVRGPLINSSLGEQTYSVYVRPFYDETDSIGTLSIFNDEHTIYSINGTAYVGSAGLNVLSQLSAGITMTAAYAVLQPTPTPTAGAGIFHSIYVVAGSTLEDEYTEGIEGDVIARDGNTLTLIGSTLFENTADVSTYIETPSQVLLGPGTIVTEDGSSSFAGLSYKSISVGQHIAARGIYSLSASGVTILDATGTSSTNTGSVRIQSTQAWGPLVSSSTGSLVLNLQTLNDWPVSDFTFTGTGTSTAQDASPAAYAVDTGTLALPAGTMAGDPLWVDGIISPFGSAAPDFIASAVYDEAGVQLTTVATLPGATATANAKAFTDVPTAGTLTCGQASLNCIPASMRVYWAHGTTAPFGTLTDSGLTIDLSNANLTSAIIRIGPETIDLSSLAATPQIIPVPPMATGKPGLAGTAGLPAIFLPLFAIGNPVTSAATTTTAPTSATSTATTSIHEYNTFSTFVAEAPTLINSDNPALQLEATGFFNRATNTFNAASINVVL